MAYPKYGFFCVMEINSGSSRCICSVAVAAAEWVPGTVLGQGNDYGQATVDACRQRSKYLNTHGKWKPLQPVMSTHPALTQPAPIGG